MYKFCVFAGTTEGKELIEFLTEQNVLVTACVATEYGESLIADKPNLTVSARRLDESDMESLFKTGCFDCVIDATHPYAPIVTKNIMAACEKTNTEYMRLLRQESSSVDGSVVMPDIESAVGYLSSTEGNILLTTGSKELVKFASLPMFSDRIFARVLPMENSLFECTKAGLAPSHIIAMQGPFSKEMNKATLRQINASYLVTKEGGSAGGFEEKAEAALEEGVKLVIIGRPVQEEGLSFSEIIDKLCSDYGFKTTPNVTIVGIGPGSSCGMTAEVRSAIDNADCLIGAKRMLESVACYNQPLHNAIAPDDIAKFIREHREYRQFTVVMSGDTGFFSGTKKLLPMLSDCDVRILPGLSSLSCLCARLGTSYEDVVCISVHGREHDIVPDIIRNRRVFTLVGGENGMAILCRHLTESGFGEVKVSVGECIGYPEEKITVSTAKELAYGHFDTLSVALIEHDMPIKIPFGLPDEEFTRGCSVDGAVVPMTKSEVRAVCLSKLQLTDDAVCWDVGAGTGSVAIEMALCAHNGRVFAIERKCDAVSLMHKNREKLFASNMEIVEGIAPDVCVDLPAPTHVFIGGSSGNMHDIMAVSLKKNPKVRIVATAIALESVAELTGAMKDFSYSESVSLTVARDRKAGKYHLMTGQNPIYIFTFQN